MYLMNNVFPSTQVKAKNSMYESNSSVVSVLKLDESARLEPITDLHVETRSNTSVTLVWSEIKHATKYHIIPKALSLVFPDLPTLEAAASRYTGKLRSCVILIWHRTIFSLLIFEMVKTLAN